MKLNSMWAFSSSQKQSALRPANTGALIMEFVGPPGVGKTTNCRQFARLLQDEAIAMATADDIKAYYRSLGSVSKLLLYARTLRCRFAQISGYLFFLLKQGVFSIGSIYRYLRLSILDELLNAYVSEKKIKIVLLDQWIIQGVWSSMIFRLQSYTAPHNLARFYFRTHAVVYFDLEDALAAERIVLRKTNHSRFDRMEAAERAEAQQKYNQFLYQLYEISACSHKLLVSTELTPAENAATLYRYAKQELRLAV